MVIKKFEFNPIAENTYVIHDETGDAAIIDCGAYVREETEMLDHYIRENHLVVTHLLNTHLHLDHALGNYFAFTTYGTAPQYNKLESECLPAITEQALAFGMANVRDVKEVDAWLEEEDIVHVGKMQLECILVPGHSPGSICFYSQEDAVLFSGDVLFQGSIGRSDLWGGNGRQLITGIRTKLLMLPDATIVYPGHGNPTTIGEEKNNNPFLY